MRMATSLLASIALCFSQPVLCQSLAVADPDLTSQIEQIRKSAMVGGPGWEAYAKLLHPDYSRSSNGGDYQKRTAFLEGFKQWWDYGMRVQKRDITPIGFDRTGNVAIIRTKVTEQFVGPKESDTSSFSGYVTDIWLLEDGSWKLLSAVIEDRTAP